MKIKVGQGINYQLFFYLTTNVADEYLVTNSGDRIIGFYIK